MKERGFRNAAVGFGLATGICIGIDGWNLSQLYSAAQDVQATTVDTSEATDALEIFRQTRSTTLQGLGVTVLAGAGTVVSLKARGALAEQEAATVQSHPTEF